MTTPSDTKTNSLGDRYDVIDAIGRGAAATVYRVRDRWSGSERAAKVLLPEAVSNEQTLRRFEDEYRILRGLHHPSLPEVYDYGWIGRESRYMIMELVDGEPLDRYFAEHPEDLWVLIYELCEVLSFIHDHNLLHQDVKPSNILVRRTTAFGEEMPLVTLLDFGLTFRRDGDEQAGMVGTPAYMAPEVIHRETALTRAVDYYSLGVTLFELLTGETPFKGTTREVLGAHLEDIPRAQREKIEYAELYPLVYGLLSKDKNERMEVFGRLRTAVLGRLVDVPEELERANALSVIRSLGDIDKSDAWVALTKRLNRDGNATVEVSGPPLTGKTYLVNKLVADRKLAGARTMVMGQGSEVEDLARAVASGSEDARAAIWSYLNEGESTPLVVLDGRLESEETRYIDYIEQRMAMDSDGQVHVVRTSRIPDSADALMLGHLKETETKSLEDRLAPRLLDDRDRTLSHIIHNSAHAGDAIRHLTSALVRGELTVRQGKWRFVRNPSMDATEDENSDLWVELMNRLPDASQRILKILALHPVPLPRSRLRPLAKVRESEIDSFVEVIRQWGVGISRGGGPKEEFVLRPSFQSAVQAQLDRSERVGVSRTAISYWREAALDELSLTCLASNYETVGEPRMALGIWLRLLRLSAMKGADDVILSTGQHILDNLGALHVSRAVEMYTIRKVLKVEKKRSRTSEVARHVQASAMRHGVFAPVLLKDYAFDLHGALGVHMVRELLQEALSASKWPQGDRRAQLMMQLLLAENNLNNSRGSSELLETILESAPSCGPRVQNEIAIKELMTLETLGREIPEAKVARAGAEALRLGNIDGYLVVQLVWIGDLFDRSQLEEAMRIIPPLVRLAHRNGVTRRQLQLYFQASAVYFGMGEYHRSIRALTRANRIASDLGMKKIYAANLLRMAMNYHCMGYFGNAVRFAEKALAADAGETDTSVRARLALADAYVVSHQPDAEEKLLDARDWLARGGRVDEVYEGLISATYEMARGEFEAAIATSSRTAERASNVELPDDAARAALIKAWAILETSDDSAFVETLSYLRQAVPDLESPMIRGELAALELAYVVKKAGDIGALLEPCERARELVNDATICLRMDRVIIDATMALGERSRASVAFDRYYRLTREIVANMLDTLDPNAFISGERINEVMERYRLFVAEA